ncbi:hypothetical protein Cni_G29525 [Canna indica]|uniref:Uncharacterized protein n=1 Tax=Canna indica TaxID=4628 RepID=A0AAQ3L5H6_9LILI|nr:hypothetical protein Cni_G29525 [Canna indica]
MHLLVYMDKLESFLFSNIYVSTDPSVRVVLWNSLNSYDFSSYPWIIMRDFIAILDSCDKFGDFPFYVNKSVNDFRSFVSNSDLVDLKFSCPNYTWCNNRKFSNRILIID